MNACGHHHVGHIGILGVDKNGSEWYQVSIGGAQGEHAAIGEVIGPSFAAHEMPDVVARLIETYVDIRARGRALRRHRAPRRPRAVQGARLCARLIKPRRASSTTRHAGRPRRGVARRPARRHARHRAARAVDGGARRRCSRAATPASGWRPADDPAALADDVGLIPVIAVDFPEFTDGRGYSIARLLRERYGYARRTARDRRRAARPALLPAAQVGFDAFAVRDDQDVRRRAGRLATTSRTATRLTAACARRGSAAARALTGGPA